MVVYNDAAVKKADIRVNTTGMVMYNDAAVKKADVRMLQDPKSREVMYNMPLEDMHAPLLGPSHPYQKDGISAGMKNHRSGHVEDSHMNPYIFEEQYHSFHSQGFSEAPGGEGVVGKPSNTKGAEGSAGASSSAAPLLGVKRPKTTAERKADAVRKLQKQAGDMSAPFTLSNKQPWAQKVAEVQKHAGDMSAPFTLSNKQPWAQKVAEAHKVSADMSAPFTLSNKQPWAQKVAEAGDMSAPFTLSNKQPWAQKGAEVSELTEEQKEYMAKVEAEKIEGAVGAIEVKGPTSFFHGKEDKDYQGRSWLDAPKGKPKESDYTFLPKRWIHTWSGHTKGVNAVRFFPDTGHLLLSAGLDGKVKIWNVGGGGKCMRTYLGHSKGVRDIQFTNDGRRFVSTGYDKNVRVWDTETGTCLRTFNTGKDQQQETCVWGTQETGTCLPAPSNTAPRHGQSRGNTDADTYKNTPDNRVPLGKKQARHAGRRIRSIMLQNEEAHHPRVYFMTSPYCRALQTCQLIADSFSKDEIAGVRQTVQLREQDFGNFQDPHSKLKFGRFWYRFSGGESGADVYDRLTIFEDHFPRDMMNGQFRDCSVVLCIHGLTLRVFLMRWFHLIWTVDEFLQVWNPQNGPIVLEKLPWADVERMQQSTYVHVKHVYNIGRNQLENALNPDDVTLQGVTPTMVSYIERVEHAQLLVEPLSEPSEGAHLAVDSTWEELTTPPAKDALPQFVTIAATMEEDGMELPPNGEGTDPSTSGTMVDLAEENSASASMQRQREWVDRWGAVAVVCGGVSQGSKGRSSGLGGAAANKSRGKNMIDESPYFDITASGACESSSEDDSSSGSSDDLDLDLPGEPEHGQGNGTLDLSDWDGEGGHGERGQRGDIQEEGEDTQERLCKDNWEPGSSVDDLTCGSAVVRMGLTKSDQI
eukprot:gene6550-3202_t